jgi:hypothetical protein
MSITIYQLIQCSVTQELNLHFELSISFIASLCPRVTELFCWTAVLLIKFCYDGHWLYCCELTLLPLSVGDSCSDTVSREVSNMSPELED